MNYLLENYRRDTGEPVPAKGGHRFKPENLIEKFPPEYAHIIGVPFKLFKGGTTTIVDPPDYTNIRALPERQKDYEIIFPNLIGYRVENLDGKLKHDFSGIENYELDFSNYPLQTVMASPISPHEEKMEVQSALEKRTRNWCSC